MTIKSKWLAPGALALRIVTTIVFMATCLDVSPGLALWYHISFQFIVAFCTGGLFTAATRQCYGDRTGNSSFGYALELGGASVAALVTIPLGSGQCPSSNGRSRQHIEGIVSWSQLSMRPA